ncbi:hypothetical protein [Halalkalibacter alkaliphilus]|uniref:Uncharacterized protein n=1 Tax=Halalkalibacter alkaliphilus TaxID=2917993 RepID=A0A9X2CTW6_9BACI|nr:hypothetical protein [Halalkalibacter alkaliphilus]MCL7748173.1 hypothetical protein [Halalkalibacter alkaliphilus]
MKVQNKSTSSFWYGSDINSDLTKRPSVAKSENEEYKALKRAIQEEARKKWGRHDTPSK